MDPSSIRRISVLTTGTVQVRPDHAACTWKPMTLWMATARNWTAPLPINAFVIEHRDRLVLFDTGQDRRSVTDASSYFPGGIVGAMYRRTAKAEIAADQTLAAGLERLGYDPSDVTDVVVSHLHQDHIGGLTQVSGATMHVSAAEWETMGERGALLKGVMKQHIDLPGLTWNRITPERTRETGLEPFDTAHDLFDDRSLTLIPTPGHTPGSMTLLVRQPGQPLVALVGDLTFSAGLLACGHVPGAGARKELRRTTAKINQLGANHGGMIVLASHDPAAAASIETTFTYS